MIIPVQLGCKYDVIKIFCISQRMIETPLGKNIKRVQSNNEKEYYNQLLLSLFQKQGIVMNTHVDTPHKMTLLNA